MMSVSRRYYFTIVKFLDTKLTYVCRSSDILNYKPRHPDEFDADATYKVLWQKAEGSFDGTYDARIISQAASLDELKLKALRSGELKKMPSNFDTFVKSHKEADRSADSDSSSKASTGDSGRKRERKKPKIFTPNPVEPKSSTSSKRPAPQKKESATSYNNAKKKRMMTTLQLLTQTRSDKTSDTEKVQLEQGEPSVTPQSDDKNSQSSDVQSSMLASDIPNSQSDVPSKETVPSLKFSDTPVLLSSDLEDNDEGPSIDNLLQNIESSVTQDKEIKTESDDSPDTLSESESVTSCSDDEVVKLVKLKENLKNDLKKKTLELKSIQLKFETQVSDLKKKHEEEVKELKTSYQVSEDIRRTLVSDLQALRKKHEESGILTENKKLKSLISTAQQLLQSGMEKFTFKTEKPVVKNLFYTPSKSDDAERSPSITGSKFGSPFRSCVTSKLSGSKSVGSRNLEESCLSSGFYVSPMKVGTSVSEPDAGLPVESSLPVSGGGSSKLHSGSSSTASTVVKAEKKRSSKSDSASPGSSSSKGQKNGLSEEEINVIAVKVQKDLTGVEPLPLDSNGKVIIGGGITLSTKKWNDAIKTQKKNSLFVKKLGVAVYGHEGLKQRTVGCAKGKNKGKDNGKQVATPVKVDAIVACLKGKLLAENPQSSNIDKIALTARAILAEKMQDEARLRDDSSKKLNIKEEPQSDD